MEHSLPRDPDSRGARRRWSPSAVAALELVILVALGVVLLAKPVSQHVQQAAEKKVFAPVKAKPRVATPVGKPKLSRAETSVIVLNGNGRSGAAAARRGARPHARLHDRHRRQRSAQRLHAHARDVPSRLPPRGRPARTRPEGEDRRAARRAPPADMMGAHLALDHRLLATHFPAFTQARARSSGPPGVHCFPAGSSV